MASGHNMHTWDGFGRHLFAKALDEALAHTPTLISRVDIDMQVRRKFGAVSSKILEIR